MKKIAVVTGGAGGMGLATAKMLGREHHVLICDMNPQRLESAVASLTEMNVSCESILCDVTDRKSVDALVNQADRSGAVSCVAHAAGISPQMADEETILRVNALGTVNIAEAFFEIAVDGFALVNVASMAAHLVPGFLLPTRSYRHAVSDPERFLRQTLFRCRLIPNQFYRNGLAYALSKHFIMSYSKKNAARFGKKNARILSVSPGTFDTEMGRLEQQSGSFELLKRAALARPGKPEEIAELISFCLSDRASYLTGVDVLCDGGIVASKTK